MTKKQDTQIQVEPTTLSLDTVYQTYNVPIDTVLSEEEKRLLADGGVEFFITDCKEAFGNYKTENNPEGMYWIFTIRSGQDERTLFMTHHEKVELQYSAIKHSIVNGPVVIGPVQLQWIERTEGNSFYKIEAARQRVQRQAEALPF